MNECRRHVRRAPVSVALRGRQRRVQERIRTTNCSLIPDMVLPIYLLLCHPFVPTHSSPENRELERGRGVSSPQFASIGTLLGGPQHHTHPSSISLVCRMKECPDKLTPGASGPTPTTTTTAAVATTTTTTTWTTPASNWTQVGLKFMAFSWGQTVI